MKAVLGIFIALLCVSLVSAANDCDFHPSAHTVQELIDEVPTLDAAVKACEFTLPSSYGALPKNGDLQLDISMNDGTHEYVSATIANGEISGIVHGKGGVCAKRIVIGEDDLDTLLQSPSRGDAARYLYGSGKASIEGCTFLSRMGLWFAQPVVRFFIRRAEPEPSTQSVEPQDGYRVCDFYQAHKKLVTCAAPKAADTFCVTTMQTTSARSLGCDENGQVLCGIPCQLPAGQRQPTQCAFDSERPRGPQAPPIDSCPNGVGNLAPAAPPAQTGKPDNCFETFVQGHEGYQYAKDLWDSYSADTDGACQSNIGVPIDTSKCVHVVQESKGGFSDYICWYDN